MLYETDSPGRHILEMGVVKGDQTRLKWEIKSRLWWLISRGGAACVRWGIVCAKRKLLFPINCRGVLSGGGFL